MAEVSPGQDLITLIERGGVLYDIPGVVPGDILESMTRDITLPENLDRESLLKAVLEREALMPTASGRGIALPHPRNPLIRDPADQFITLGFPRKPVDWKALDGKPVHAVFLIVSASPKLHLRTLSKISFLCQQEGFLDILINHASRDTIIGAIKDAEAAWI